MFYFYLIDCGDLKSWDKKDVNNQSKNNFYIKIILQKKYVNNLHINL